MLIEKGKKYGSLKRSAPFVYAVTNKKKRRNAKQFIDWLLRRYYHAGSVLLWLVSTLLLLA